MMVPIFAGEKRAAELLDMPRSLFRRLVAAGTLPPPNAIGDEKRWDVEALKRAIRGEPSSIDDVPW